MAPSKHAILAQCNGKLKRKQEWVINFLRRLLQRKTLLFDDSISYRINAEKEEWGKCGSSKLEMKHKSRAKANRKGTICRKTTNGKPKRSREVIDKKTAKKRNAVADNETSTTLKLSTFGPSVYETRANSKMVSTL